MFAKQYLPVLLVQPHPRAIPYRPCLLLPARMVTFGGSQRSLQYEQSSKQFQYVYSHILKPSIPKLQTPTSIPLHLHNDQHTTLDLKIIAHGHEMSPFSNVTQQVRINPITNRSINIRQAGGSGVRTSRESYLSCWQVCI